MSEADWFRNQRARQKARREQEKAEDRALAKYHAWQEEMYEQIRAEGWLPAVSDVKAIIGICGGDGWGVYSPDTFKAAGVNERWIDMRTWVHRSDGSYKGSMWDADGNMVAEQKGVNSEWLLVATAEMLGLTGNWTWQQGRGFRAQSATKALYEWMVEAEKNG